MCTVSLFKNFVNKVEDKPLNEILINIKNGKYASQINKIRDSLNNGKNDEADALKKELLAFTASGTFLNGRSVDKIDQYSQHVILDIDKLSTKRLKNAILKTRLSPYTYAYFISPSGNGLKIIVKVDSQKEQHKQAINQVADYYEKALNESIDMSGSDICRLCFISYDKDCFIKESPETFNVTIQALNNIEKSKVNKTNDLNPFDLLENCLKFTEQKEQYTDGNRNNFVYLFASNANRFGIPEINTLNFCLDQFDLKENEIAATVKSSYKNNIADFAKFAKFANSTNEGFLKTEEKQSIENLSLLTSTPTIPDNVYETLPIIFQKGVEHINGDREKDVFLTGALSILSGCLPNVEGLYGGKVVYPNLFSFLLAPPASGKGTLTFAKMLADKYHNEVISNSRNELNQFQQEMEAHKQAKKYLKKGEQPPEPPEEPEFKVVYIPANTSNAKIIKHLQDNDGFGIICETEADTLGQTFKNDWGSYSDLLRKAYHHEKISISRKSNNEYFELDNPRLSVTLSGTPNQILSIMQSAEDGLFSRFLFYVFASEPRWLDPSPKSNPVNLTEYFKQLSNYVYRMVNFFESSKTRIQLTEQQWEKFNPLFDEYLFRIYNLVNHDATSIVKRLGLIVYRFCMIFTAMRKFENQTNVPDVFCTDMDFDNALILADIYLQHSLLVYRNLPNQESKIDFKPTTPKFNFYKKLPNEFERKKAVEIGNSLTISERTVDYHLSKLETAGYLSKPKAGYYIKAKK